MDRERTDGKQPERHNTGGDAPAPDPSRWVDSHGDILFRYALIRVKDPHIAEDLVQETFLSALASVDRFRGGSSVRTWLIGILKHKILDHYRKSTDRFTASERAEEDEDEAGFFGRMGIWGRGHRPTAWNRSPDDILENKEFYRVFLGCLDNLTMPLRNAFSMRELDGMESDEICKVLGITPTNLWVMLHRSRRKLRECLETNWFRERGS